jgi:hypothetical protein
MHSHTILARRMRCSALALLVAALGGAAVPAQSGSGYVGATSSEQVLKVAEMVVPNGNAAVEASGVAFWAFSPFDARRQLLYASRLLARLQGRTLMGLRARRDASTDYYASGQINIEVWLSHSPRSPWDMSNVFASNRGADHVKVFDGFVGLPASPPPNTAPATWDYPFAVAIPFDTPFVYQTGALCVETVTKNSNANSPWWPIDASITPFTGSVTPFGASCITGMGLTPASADAGSITIGSTGIFYLKGRHAAGMAVCMLGMSNTQFGSLQLPLDLGPVAAPGCRLYTSSSLLIPAMLDVPAGGPIGIATAPLDLPVNPGLQGVTLYAQWALAEAGVNPLGVTFSNGVAATIGASRMRNISWLESESMSSPSGAILAGRVPVLRFDSN